MKWSSLKHGLQNWFMEKTCHLTWSSLVWPSNLVGCWVRVISPLCYLLDPFPGRKSVECLESFRFLRVTCPPLLSHPYLRLPWITITVITPFVMTVIKCLTGDSCCDDRLIWGSQFECSVWSSRESLMTAAVCGCSYRRVFALAGQQSRSSDNGARNGLCHNYQALCP